MPIYHHCQLHSALATSLLNNFGYDHLGLGFSNPTEDLLLHYLINRPEEPLDGQEKCSMEFQNTAVMLSWSCWRIDVVVSSLEQSQAPDLTR